MARFSTQRVIVHRQDSSEKDKRLTDPGDSGQRMGLRNMMNIIEDFLVEVNNPNRRQARVEQRIIEKVQRRGECSIRECSQPLSCLSLGSFSLYCSADHVKFESEFIRCKGFNCDRWAAKHGPSKNDAWYCSMHGGLDYTARTTCQASQICIWNNPDPTAAFPYQVALIWYGHFTFASGDSVIEALNGLSHKVFIEMDLLRLSPRVVLLDEFNSLPVYHITEPRGIFTP
jgi:hypothetical protein